MTILIYESGEIIDVIKQVEPCAKYGNHMKIDNEKTPYFQFCHPWGIEYFNDKRDVWIDGFLMGKGKQGKREYEQVTVKFIRLRH